MEDSSIAVETERLILRPLRKEDADGILAIFSDPVAMRYALTGPRDRRHVEEWIELVARRFAQDGHGFWAAELKADGSYAGHAGLLLQEVEGVREVEIGYWFRRKFWGLGLASEAAATCRDYGFDVLGRRRLVSLIHPDNIASRRVAEKTGLSLERQAVWRERKIDVFSIHR